MNKYTFEIIKGKIRYYLANVNEVPIQPALNHLRFESNRGLQEIRYGFTVSC